VWRKHLPLKNHSTKMGGAYCSSLMQNYFINNRYGLKIAIVVERPWFPRGTALFMHGLGATKEQKHITACSRAFRAHRYITVRFDATNSFGESGGDFQNATLTSYFEDLEDVTVWVRQQAWFCEPFILAGHSLGGMCAAQYAECNPEQVAALVPLSAPVSGSLLLNAVEKRYPEEVRIWRETGKVVFNENMPSYMKLLLPDNVASFLSYDLLPKAPALSMPTLFIVGENDWLTPPSSVQKLYEGVSGKKEIHVISGAPHTFREQAHIRQITDIMTVWIRTLAR